MNMNLKKAMMYIMKHFRRNSDLVFNLKLLCTSLIFGGYMLIFFVFPLLLITALPILAFINIFVVAVGIFLEIFRLTEKKTLRIISDICIIAGVIYFVCIFLRMFYNIIV